MATTHDHAHPHAHDQTEATHHDENVGTSDAESDVG